MCHDKEGSVGSRIGGKGRCGRQEKVQKEPGRVEHSPISRESFPDDFADGFDFVDRTGSGAFEAFAGRLETNLVSAPCAQCPKDCPGSHGECLLNVDPGVLQDHEDLAVEEAEMSPFVLAAVRAGFDYDAALRMEVKMETEMSRLAGEMDSIH